jgi:predicted NAD/FAD-dependent oxidoreductase
MVALDAILGVVATRVATVVGGDMAVAVRSSGHGGRGAKDTAGGMWVDLAACAVVCKSRVFILMVVVVLRPLLCVTWQMHRTGHGVQRTGEGGRGSDCVAWAGGVAAGFGGVLAMTLHWQWAAQRGELGCPRR